MTTKACWSVLMAVLLGTTAGFCMGNGEEDEMDELPHLSAAASTVEGKDYYQQYLDATGVLYKLRNVSNPSEKILAERRNALEMLRDALKNALPHLKLQAAQWLHIHGDEADQQKAINFYRETLRDSTTEDLHKLNAGHTLLRIDNKAHRDLVIPVFEKLAQKGDGSAVSGLMGDTPEIQERTRVILRKALKSDAQNKDSIAENLYRYGTAQDKTAVVKSYLDVVGSSEQTPDRRFKAGNRLLCEFNQFAHKKKVLSVLENLATGNETLLDRFEKLKMDVNDFEARAHYNN